MPFQPFQTELATQRVVRIPADLDDDARQRLLAKLTAAARQQEELCAKSFGVLRITGEPTVASDQILIPHEPAAPLDPNQLEDADERPDILSLWWLSIGPLDALKHAAASGIPHGGIQSGALYRDESGRIKLGDFGIAPAFETICGTESRRQLHCNVDDASGGWTLLSEDDHRDYGWIAPYFAHELLEGKLRLNPKSDQFALGTLLFMLATGTHPYGAALSDPTMLFYFHLEPYEIRDERSDWSEAFERADQDLSGSDDAPILAWSDFSRKVLASDSGQRYAHGGEALDEYAALLPAAWLEWSEGVHAAEQILLSGDVPGFLAAIEQLPSEPELPVLTAEPFAAWVSEIATKKDEIARGRQREQQLAEADRALDDLELDKVEEITAEIIADDQCDPQIVESAKALLEQAREQSALMKSGADALAEAYLKSARDCLEHDRLHEARELIDGVLADPGTPPARAAQARDLLTDLELLTQRTEQQVETLAAAAEDSREGRYDAAVQRLQQLLDDPQVPEAFREQAALLVQDVEALQAARAAYVAHLEEARAAWERADHAAITASLEQVPSSIEDRELLDVRSDLVERSEALAAALQERDAAQAAAEAGDWEQVATRLLPLVDDEALPQLLRDECQTLRGQARTELERLYRERIDAARARLEEAEQQFEAGGRDTCRAMVADEVLAEAALPDEDRLRAEQLLARCDACDAVLQEVRNARGHAEAEAFAQGLAILDALTLDDMPHDVLQEVEAVRTEIERDAAAHAESARAAIRSQLNDLPTQLEAGALGAVGSVLDKLAADPFLDDELQARMDALRTALDALRPIEMALERIEGQLADGGEAAQAQAALDQLPEELPAWAETRAEAAREQLEARRVAARRAAQEALGGELESIDARVRAADSEAARAALDAFDRSDLDPELAERWKQLDQACRELEAWVPRLREAEVLLDSGDVAAAHRGGMGLSEEEGLPAPLKPRLEELLRQTKQRIVTRREEIDTELGSIDKDMEWRGKRARGIPGQLTALGGDPLATKAQKQTVAELQARFEALPEPTASRVPMIAGGVVGLVVLLGAGWFLMRPGPPQNGDNGGNNTNQTDPTPIPPTDYTPQIAAAQARLNNALQSLQAAASSAGRTGPAWQLVFEPTNAFPTQLYAVADGQRIGLGQANTLGDLEVLTLPADADQRLWQDASEPQPQPQPVALRDRVAATLTRLQTALDAQRQPTDPPMTLAFAGTTETQPGTLELQAEGQRFALAQVSADQLDTLAFEPTWLEPIRTPRQMQAVLQQMQTRMDSERAAAAGAPPRYQLAFVPANQLPTVLRATGDDGSTEDLAEIADAAALQRLEWTPEMTARLFPGAPPVSMFERVGTVRDAVMQQVVGISLEASIRDETASLVGTLDGVTLLPLSLQIDGDAILPIESDAVAHFAVQADAVRALRTSPNWVAFDAAYDGRFEGDWSGSEVEQVANGVAMRIPTRLSDAPGNDTFAVSGFVTDGALRPDRASRDNWQTYLSGLRRAAWDASLSDWQTQIALPDPLRLTAPDPLDLQDQVPLEVVVGGDTLLTVNAAWAPAALTYQLDTAAAQQAVGTYIAGEMQAAEATLVEAWPTLRSELVTGLDLGADALGEATCQSVTVGDAAPANLLEAPVALQVEVGGAAVTLNARARWQADQIGWASVNAGERSATRDALNRLAGDATYRAAQNNAALARLSSEQNVSLGAAQPRQEGNQLVLDAPDGATYTWDWDTSRLAWGTPNKTSAAAPTPAGLDAQLAQLASKGQVTPAELASALTEVAREKQQRTSTRLPVREGASLETCTEAFRNTISGDLRGDAYPTIFVEYFVGADTVYGLGWRIEAGRRDRLQGIRDPKVWEVCPTSQLRSYSSLSALQQAYSNANGLGGRLLGPAIANPVQGTVDGSYGLAVAPDGPLWMIRWEQVRFPNVTVSGGIRENGKTTPKSIDRLHELVCRQRSGADWVYPRAGIWMTPSFAFGKPNGQRVTLKLEGATPDGQAHSVRFGTTNSSNGRLVGTIKYPRSAQASGVVDGEVRALALGTFGRFSNTGWSGGRWEPHPVLGFAVLMGE